MTKTQTNATASPGSAEFENGRQEVIHELAAAQAQFDQAAFACSIDRDNAAKRAAFDEADRTLSRLKAELSALSGAKAHAQKQESLLGLEQELADLEAMRRDSLAAVDAAGPAFEAMFAAIRQLGQAWRDLKTADADATRREGACFIKRGGMEYPNFSLKSHPQVQALLAWELQGHQWDLIPEAFRQGDSNRFDPDVTRQANARQRERACGEINRFCNLRAEALRQAIDAKRGTLAAA